MSSTNDHGNIDDDFYPGPYTNVICINKAKSKLKANQNGFDQIKRSGEDVKVEVTSIQVPTKESYITTAAYIDTVQIPISRPINPNFAKYYKIQII